MRKFITTNFKKFAACFTRLTSEGVLLDAQKMKEFLITTTTFDLLDINELEEELEKADEMAQQFKIELD
jgi:hypothetical protein